MVAEPGNDPDATGAVTVGSLAALPEDEGVLVGVGGRQVAVFRQGETAYAIDRTCPHAGGPLEEGFVMDGLVTCPLHAYTFDLETGQCLEDPGLVVDCFPVRVEGGVVIVGRSPNPAEHGKGHS